MSVKTLAIGDIHGCLHALETLAAFVPFQEAQRVVALGDYVDRGPDSRGVLEWLIEFSLSGRLVPLHGNHELMMLRAPGHTLTRNTWLAAGGFETLASYAPSARYPGLDLVPDAHWEFLKGCVPYHETDTHIFVHASVNPHLSLAEQSEYTLCWSRFSDGPPHLTAKHVICGHTAQLDGEPKAHRHSTCIDTHVYGGGWLTALEAETGRYWQANERGETRKGQFAAPVENA